jgi:tripartite-type tricarboxylate transporter receptor subunit TctC
MKTLIFLLTLLTFNVSAQTTLIIPFSPGASYDMMGRKLAPYLEKELQEKVTVINVPGAGGTIGVNKLDNSPKNTILLAGPWFYTMLASNNQPLSKYKYPGIVGESFLYLAVSKKSGLTCEQIKESSKPIFLGSNGPRTIASVAVEIVREKYSNVTEVPYKGGGAQIVDVLNGTLTGTFVLSKATNRADVYDILANTSAHTIDGIISWKECLGIPKTLTNQYFMVTTSAADDSYITAVNTAIKSFAKEPEGKSYFNEEGIQHKSNDVNNTYREVEKSFNSWRTK